jgi:Uma2 family endonuclease
MPKTSSSAAPEVSHCRRQRQFSKIYQEYFAWEEQQLHRHEYIDGGVYAMSGGTISHSEIALNFGSLLKAHLRGSGCKTLNSDARVNILESSHFVYPDVSVTCDERDKTTAQYITYPCLVVEVLSPNTESYDSPLETLCERGNKFKPYRCNPLLQEYVLVDSEAIAIEIFRKSDDNKWQIIDHEPRAMVELASFKLTFPIEQVYEDVVFPEKKS